jgi:hypothetical protein
MRGRQATRLGPLVELDTTGLSIPEMCRLVWDLVTQSLRLSTQKQ